MVPKKRDLLIPFSPKYFKSHEFWDCFDVLEAIRFCMIAILELIYNGNDL